MRLLLLLWTLVELLISAVGDGYDKDGLIAEVERLKAEVARLQAGDGIACGTASRSESGGVAQATIVRQQLEALQTSVSDLSRRASSNVRLNPLDLGPLGIGTTSKSAETDACSTNPLYKALQGALQKLALLEQDPVEASYEIHTAWEEDPSLFEVCPVGLITALVYLSIAQEKEWKYRLLHQATFLLYSTPGLASKMANGRWPMSDRLIRTMYHNSEVIGRAPLKLSEVPVSSSPVLEAGVDESVGFSLQHGNSVQVHFGTVLFYHFYYQEKSPCACRTRSWCVPHWLRHFTNKTVDIWLAARDEQKTLYRMDSYGCFRSLGYGLASHYFAEPIDLVFVFEINALMHPQNRVVPAHRIILYPTFDLSEPQLSNFEELGVSVLPDDAILKPPNPATRQVLEEASQTRLSRSLRPKDRLLIFPADIRPMKGQTDFLKGLLFEGAKKPSAVKRLQGLTIVIAGGCDGNMTYCSEVVSLTQRLNAEGLLNVVVADQLKDLELAQLYAAALGVVLHSRIDCNPRSVYEGLIANAPFFVTDKTRLPSTIHHLGHIHDGNEDKLPERLADFVDLAEANTFENRPRDFARKHIREADVYKRMVEWMDTKYLTGKRLETIIRGEEALGSVGGLSGLLGGGDLSSLGSLGKVLR